MTEDKLVRTWSKRLKGARAAIGKRDRTAMQKAFRRAAWTCEKEVKDLSMDGGPARTTTERITGQGGNTAQNRNATEAY